MFVVVLSVMFFNWFSSIFGWFFAQFLLHVSLIFWCVVRLITCFAIVRFDYTCPPVLQFVSSHILRLSVSPTRVLQYYSSSHHVFTTVLECYSSSHHILCDCPFYVGRRTTFSRFWEAKVPKRRALGLHFGTKKWEKKVSHKKSGKKWCFASASRVFWD